MVRGDRRRDQASRVPGDQAVLDQSAEESLALPFKLVLRNGMTRTDPGRDRPYRPRHPESERRPRKGTYALQSARLEGRTLGQEAVTTPIVPARASLALPGSDTLRWLQPSVQI